MRSYLLTTLLAAGFVGCAEPAPPAPSTDEVRAAIEAQNRAFGEAVHASDTAALGALYTQDGAVLPPGGARVTGRAAVTEFWGAALASGVANAVLTTEEVAYAGGDTATEVGSAVLSAKDGSVVDEGKYVVLWKQEAGAWRLHRDIWNSNRAPAPNAAPADASARSTDTAADAAAIAAGPRADPAP
jgi:uncharacterized protein (TIGR02246 family)